MNLNITDFDLGTLWLSLSLREAALYCEHNAPLVPWRKRDAASVLTACGVLCELHGPLQWALSSSRKPHRKPARKCTSDHPAEYSPCVIVTPGEGRGKTGSRGGCAENQCEIFDLPTQVAHAAGCRRRHTRRPWHGAPGAQRVTLPL